MLHQKREEGKRNGRLACTNCGNPDVIATLRLRHPHGWQVYASCPDCGARNWEEDQGKAWAYIRYRPTTEEREVN